MTSASLSSFSTVSYTIPPSMTECHAIVCGENVDKGAIDRIKQGVSISVITDAGISFCTKKSINFKYISGRLSSLQRIPGGVIHSHHMIQA